MTAGSTTRCLKERKVKEWLFEETEVAPAEILEAVLVETIVILVALTKLERRVVYKCDYVGIMEQ